MTNVLVTDGNERAALALVRSLGRAGHHLVVADERRGSLAGASRFAGAEVVTPSPLDHTATYIEQLRKEIAKRNIDVLIPVSEAALRAVLAHRDLFPTVRIPFPEASVFSEISDKRILLDRAEELGIPVPKQIVCESPTEIDAVADRTEAFPVVLKPARSVAGEEGDRIRFSVAYAESRSELRNRLRGLDPRAFPVLVQEKIVGPGAGVFILMKDGELRTVFAHERIREKPPSGGVSVLRESVPADPERVDYATRLLRSFGWEGVAMVEFKLDARSGRPYLMEVNGRFWGSLQLAVDSGADFPVRLLDTTSDAGEIDRYQVGVRTRWEWGEVDHLIAQMKARRGIVPALAGLLPWRPGVRNEVFRWSDPRPFGIETYRWIQEAGRSLFGSSNR